MKNPFILVNDNNIELNLTCGPPAYLKKELLAAISRQHLRTFKAKAVRKGWMCDAQANDHFDFQLLRQVAGSKKLNAHEKRCLVQAATGKTILANRMIQMGADIAEQCPLCCASDIDSVYHRVFRCCKLNAMRANLVKAATVERAHTMGATLLTNKGIPVSTHKIIPLKEEAVVWWVDGGGKAHSEGWSQFDSRDGKVYCDGSVSNPTHSHIAAAGWACVRIQQDGSVIKALVGTLPRESNNPR